MEEVNILLMKLSDDLYGTYNQQACTFRCTHGGWSSDCDLLDEFSCHLVALDKTYQYEFINEIPEEYARC